VRIYTYAKPQAARPSGRKRTEAAQFAAQL
jgi:hypothetical protein